MSGWLLNVDMWHPVEPETNKIHRLSRGDKVPSWALPEGDDLEAVTTQARVPMFVKDESDAGPRNTAADAAGEAGGVKSASPQAPKK